MYPPPTDTYTHEYIDQGENTECENGNFENSEDSQCSTKYFEVDLLENTG